MAGSVKKPLILAILAVPFAGLFLMPSVNAQQTTNLNFELCGNETPEVIVATPKSDSITNLKTINLSGKAKRTTQIEVSINGTFDQSIAIGQNSDSFNTDITLQPGTNSVLLNAFYSCNSNTSSTNVIVSYQPGSSESSGSDVSTEALLPSNNDNIETISNPMPGEDIDRPQTLLERVAENLGFGADINESIVRPTASWVGLILGTGSAFLAVSPLYFSVKLFEVLGWQHLRFLGQTHKIILRIIFGVLGLLMAIFVQA